MNDLIETHNHDLTINHRRPLEECLLIAAICHAGLYDNNAVITGFYNRCLTILDSNDFTQPETIALFDLMTAMYEKRDIIYRDSVISELELRQNNENLIAFFTKKVLPDNDRNHHLARLEMISDDTSRLVEWYRKVETTRLEIIVELSFKRAVAILTREVYKAQSEYSSPEEFNKIMTLYDEALLRLKDVRDKKLRLTSGLEGRPVGFGEAVERLLNRVNGPHDEENKDILYFGLPSLDSCETGIGGIRVGKDAAKILTICGESESGKTTLATQLISNYFKETGGENGSVVFCSFDMSVDDITNMIISHFSGIAVPSLEDARRFTQKDWALLKNGLAKMTDNGMIGGKFIALSMRTSPYIEDCATALEKIHKQNPIKFVVMDYFQSIFSRAHENSQYTDERREAKTVVEKVARFVAENDITIVMLAQMNQPERPYNMWLAKNMTGRSINFGSELFKKCRYVIGVAKCPPLDDDSYTDNPHARQIIVMKTLGRRKPPIFDVRFHDGSYGFSD